MPDPVEAQKKAAEAKTEADELYQKLQEILLELNTARDRHSSATERYNELDEIFEDLKTKIKQLEAIDPVKAAKEEHDEEISTDEKEYLKQQHQLVIKTISEEKDLIHKQWQTAADDLDSEKKKFDELKKETEKLEKQAKKARKKEYKLTEEAIVATEDAIKGEPKKKFFWLSWDGVYSNEGTCNLYERPEAKKKGKKLRDDMAPLHKAKRTLCVSPVDIEKREEFSAKISTKDSVSVRIYDCEDYFHPLYERCCLKIGLKRIYLIKSMMMRVYNQEGGVVYQEILNAEQIDQLPPTTKEVAVHPMLETKKNKEDLIDDEDERKRVFKERIDNAKEYADTEGSPYKFQVWVSKEENAFADIDIETEPVVKYGDLQHNETIRSKDGLPIEQTRNIDKQKTKYVKNQEGYNQIAARGVRIINVAMLAKTTNSKSDDSAGAGVEEKVNAVFAAMDKVDTALKEKRKREVRILLAPEWNFQKNKTRHMHYSYGEMNQIIGSLQEKYRDQEKYKQWLMLPGTVLWGSKIEEYGINAVFNTMPIIWGESYWEYNKKQFGDDTPMRPEHYEFTYSWGAFKKNETKVLNAKKIPSSLNTDMTAKNPKWAAPFEVTKITQGKLWQVEAKDVNFTVYQPSPNERKFKVFPKEYFGMYLDETIIDNSEYDRTSFIAVDGLKLCVEICADHGNGRAIKSYVADNGNSSVTSDKDKGVDLHMVCSYGKDLRSNKSTTRTGGLMMLCDGQEQKSDKKRVCRAIRERPVDGEAGMKVGVINEARMYQDYMDAYDEYNESSEEEKEEKAAALNDKRQRFTDIQKLNEADAMQLIDEENLEELDGIQLWRCLLKDK